MAKPLLIPTPAGGIPQVIHTTGDKDDGHLAQQQTCISESSKLPKQHHASPYKSGSFPSRNIDVRAAKQGRVCNLFCPAALLYTPRQAPYPDAMGDKRLGFAAVEEAAEEIRQGRMIVLVDDEDRENEGDLTMAAEKITPEAINFMAKFGRGLVCLALTEQRCDELNLPLMSPINTSTHGTAFTEAIDAKVGVSTGISASDRAITILTAIDAKTRPQDLARPGHMFPLRARNGGVLVRAGQTEASVDLARIAGLNPSGVICEIMNEDGTMSRVPQLMEFCREHGLKMLTVADLIRYRMQHERYVRRVAEATLPTRFGEFRMIAYASDMDHDQHIALVRGELEGAAPPLVRVHSHCLTGDVFGSVMCDCPDLIAKSLEKIAQEGRGVFLYLHHTGRGFSIETPEAPGKLPQIHFHSRGQLDREPARQRMVQHESGIGAQILIDLGLKDIRVITNHPKKVVALEGYGIRIADQVPLNLDAPKPTHQPL
jgi:3,4-dihydroxy 2-butanone 4-phosphate synthase/GTP cyclohydrolase II